MDSCALYQLQLEESLYRAMFNQPVRYIIGLKSYLTSGHTFSRLSPGHIGPLVLDISYQLSKQDIGINHSLPISRF